MAFYRSSFRVSSDALTHYSEQIRGAIMQVEWAPTQGSSEAGLKLSLAPEPGDSGSEWEFADYSDLSATFVRAPYVPFDAGGEGPGAPIIAAGDRIKAEVYGDTGVSGTVYVWTAD